MWDVNIILWSLLLFSTNAVFEIFIYNWENPPERIISYFRNLCPHLIQSPRNSHLLKFVI